MPALGFRGTLRFIWNQLTSMRTALALLFLPPIQTLLNVKIFRAGSLGGYAELAPERSLTHAPLCPCRLKLRRVPNSFVP